MAKKQWSKLKAVKAKTEMFCWVREPLFCVLLCSFDISCLQYISVNINKILKRPILWYLRLSASPSIPCKMRYRSIVTSQTKEDILVHNTTHFSACGTHVTWLLFHNLNLCVLMCVSSCSENSEKTAPWFHFDLWTQVLSPLHQSQSQTVVYTLGDKWSQMFSQFEKWHLEWKAKCSVITHTFMCSWEISLVIQNFIYDDHWAPFDSYSHTGAPLARLLLHVSPGLPLSSYSSSCSLPLFPLFL